MTGPTITEILIELFLVSYATLLIEWFVACGLAGAA